MGSGGVGFPLGLRRLTGLKELGFLDPPAPPAACVVWESGVSTRERAVPSGASSHHSGRCVRPADARTGSNSVCAWMRGRRRGGGSVSVARALVVVARRRPAVPRRKRTVVVAGGQEEGRRKRARREGGACAHQVPRRCRSPTFRRSRKGAATRLCFRCTWKCERGRNAFGVSEKNADGD